MGSSKTKILFLCLTLLINAVLLWFYHDKFWCQQDDGVFVHVADRLLSGEVLSRDVQDVHPGYVNFINLAALKVFGHNFLSLRYPLILITFLQVLIIYIMFSFQSPFMGLVVATAGTVLGILQFINPNHHWYCLFFTWILIYSMFVFPKYKQSRYILFGFLIATIYLFRQFTGVFVGMGVLAYLLVENYDAKKNDQTLLAKMIIFILICGFSFYLWKATDFFGFILFGVWPIFLLGWTLVKTTISNRNILQILKRLALGGGVGFLPLFLYHIAHGTLGVWLYDTTIRATASVGGQDFIHLASYGFLLKGGWINIVGMDKISYVLNGFFWLMVMLIPVGLGITTIYLLEKKKAEPHQLLLPWMAIFYGLVALHNQIPAYLFFAVGLSLCGLVWNVYNFFPKGRIIISPLIMFLIFIGVYYQAGQSISRGWAGIIKGERYPWVLAKGQLANNDLWIDQEQIATYAQMIEIIQKHSSPQENILAIPNNAEIYFLSDRKNSFPFFSTDHGVLSEADLERVIQQIKDSPPKIITYCPQDKRNTVYSEMIMDFVRKNYTLIKQVAGFEIYQYS